MGGSSPGWGIFFSFSKNKIKNYKKIECAGRESNPGLIRGRDVYYHCTTGAQLFVPRLELGTSRVLGERHDQLDHTNEWVRVEYQGFDPCTSSLLRTHASDCANAPTVAGSRGQHKRV